MSTVRHRHQNKKKSTIEAIPELTTAQLTFNKTNQHKPEDNINAKEIL